MNRAAHSDGSDPFEDLPEIDARICDWVDGCLSERELARFEAELRVNPQLRRQLEDYEATVSDVREALGQSTVDVPLADRVLAALEAPAAASRAPGVRRVTPIWALAAAAALLAAVVWIDEWATRSSQTTVASRPVPSADVEPLDARGDGIGSGAGGQFGRRPSFPRAQRDGVAELSAPDARREAARVVPDAIVAEAGPAAASSAPAAGAAEVEAQSKAGRRVEPGPVGPESARSEASATAARGRRAKAVKAPQSSDRPADAVSLTPLVRLELPAAARSTLARWRAAASAQRPGEAPSRATLDRSAARGWFAREALGALEGAEPAPGVGSVSGLGPLRFERIADEGAWLIEGSRSQIGALLGVLAGFAGEVGGVVQRGEIGRPPAVDGPEDRARAARARVVLRFDTRR